jgi:hypothetical protein
MNLELTDSVKPFDDEIDRAATYVFVIRESYQNIFKRLGLSPDPIALTQTEDTGIGASFARIALAAVVHVKGRQSLLRALM